MAGVTKNDRMLASRVRNLVLTQIESVLNGDDENFKKQLLLKLATNALPRLNEHTGEDGEPINLKIINYGQLGDSLSVQTEGVSVGGSESTTEVQDSSDAQEGGEE